MNVLQKMVQLQNRGCRDSSENPWACRLRCCPGKWEVSCSNSCSSSVRQEEWMWNVLMLRDWISHFSVDTNLNYPLNAPCYYLVPHVQLGWEVKTCHFGNANVNVFYCSYLLNLDELFNFFVLTLSSFIERFAPPSPPQKPQPQPQPI